MKKTCKQCGGRGKIAGSAMADFGSGSFEEVRCDACTGFGVIYTKDERATPAAASAGAAGTIGTFQHRVQPWMMACFGPAISADRAERNHRFLEESLELVQSTGCSAHEAHQLVDYVFGRPVGESAQEVGGVMVTLAALCLANELDMHECGEIELDRIWTKVEAIRAKQATKPKHGPLPGPSAATAPVSAAQGKAGDADD